MAVRSWSPAPNRDVVTDWNPGVLTAAQKASECRGYSLSGSRVYSLTNAASRPRAGNYMC